MCNNTGLDPNAILPTRLHGEVNVSVANGVPLAINGAHWHPPVVWTEPSQLRNVGGNLDGGNENKCINPQKF